MNFVLVQNTLVTLIVTGITFVILFLLNVLNKKRVITSEVSRKIVHIGAGTLYLALYFYNDNGRLSKYFNIFPNLLWIGILIWKSQHYSYSTHQKHDFVISNITRNHNSNELLRGPLFFNIIAIISGTVAYKTVLGSMIVAILTWGDGLAAVIGVKYGSQRVIYKKKTFYGCLTFFFASLIGSIIYISILIDFQSIHMLKISFTCLIATVIETITPSDFDNLTIPLSIAIVHYFLF